MLLKELWYVTLLTTVNSRTPFLLNINIIVLYFVLVNWDKNCSIVSEIFLSRTSVIWLPAGRVVKRLIKVATGLRHSVSWYLPMDTALFLLITKHS